MSGPVQVSFLNALTAAPGTKQMAFGDEWAQESSDPIVLRRDPAVNIVVRPKQETTRPLDVVKLAKARLREVKKELRRMQALEKERTELERLIEAAEGKRTTNSARRNSPKASAE